MMADAIAAGAQAPRFSLPSTVGPVSLDAMLANGRAIVAFYAEDSTPSCETEVAMLRDSHELLAEFGASVVAISSDDMAAHEAFAVRLGGLPFPLAVDSGLEVAMAYGVVDQHDRRRAQRAVFVIERDGTVLRAIVPFQPKNLAHAEAIFLALAAEG